MSATLDSFARDPRPLRLQCGVQHYDWGQRGSSAFIPSLLGVAPEGDRAYAELWIGAHAVLPSEAVLDDGPMALPALIDAQPATLLGPEAVRRFGPRLPFLLKVLAAERMLSIQAHPNPQQAREGFAREEAAGIPRGAERRSYRDDSHKPELIVALTDFYALCGFRPSSELERSRGLFPELFALLDERRVPATDVNRAFTTVMSLDRPTLDRVAGAAIERLQREDAARPFDRSSAAYWVLRADRQFTRDGRRDPGVLAMPLLNLVRLAPGQALFLGAGELHSYLEGVGVELMASSDNVLRGGLTSKHVDVDELQRVLTFRSGPAEPIVPDARGVYPTPAAEFELSAIALGAGETWRAPAQHAAPDVLLVLAGSATLRAGRTEMPLGRGATVLVPAAVGDYELRAQSGLTRVFRATIP